MEDHSRITVRDYHTALSSSSPTPGGGTAAAMSLGQAAALTCMVCDLTISKEKWRAGWQAAEGAQEVAIPLFQLAFELANEDSAAFEAVMSSYRMAKDSDAEKSSRSAAIRAASIHAAEVPLHTAREAAGLLQVMAELAGGCNSNTISDLGVAALLAHAACRGALYNVDINLANLADVEEMLESASSISERLEDDLLKVLEVVESRLGE